MSPSASARKRPAIGALRHLVDVVLVGAPAADGAGGFEQVEIPAVPPQWRCSIEGAAQWNEHRAVPAGVVQANASHVLTGRNHPQISTSARLYFNGRRFDVGSVDHVDERGLTIVVLATEVVDGGE